MILPLTHRAGRATYRNSTRCPTVKLIDFLALFTGTGTEIVIVHQLRTGITVHVSPVRLPVKRELNNIAATLKSGADVIVSTK
jgi:hypothetical protein